MVRKAQKKDMSELRETVPFKVALDKHLTGVGLKDKTMRHRCHIEWDMNEETKRDQLFRFYIDDQYVLIDLEELLSYTRLM